MDFISIIQSLQDLLYEIVIWVLLLPKTLFRAVFRPDLMVKYVNEEWKKEAEKRFDDYLSPVIFFLIMAVLPTALLTWSGDLATEKGGALAQLTEGNLITSTVTTLISILIYLVWLEWLNKRPIKRSTSKRLFFIQCYLVTPAQFIYILGLLSADLLGNTFIGLMGTLLIIVYESFAFQNELNIPWWKGFLYALPPQIAIIIIISIPILLLASK